MSFFIKHAKANRSGVLVMLGFQLFLFLLGFFMVLGINRFINEDRDYAAIASMMALMGTVFGGLVRGAGAPTRYCMAVSMGHTRRAYMIADPIITAINSLIGIGAAFLLNKFELWMYSLIYPGWELSFDVFVVFKLWQIPIFVIGLCILDFCLGALQLRFGAKGFAAVWFPFCFLPMICMNSIEAAKEGGTSLLAQLGNGILFLVGLLSPAAWAAAGIVLVLVLVVLSGLCYRSAAIKA